MDDRSHMRVYGGPVLAVVTHLKHVLEMNGIQAEVRGEYRGTGLGGVPLTEAWPELWVLDPARIAEARRLVEEALKAGPSEVPERECSSCHETVEAQFTECWSCGAKMEEPIDS